MPHPRLQKQLDEVGLDVAASPGLQRLLDMVSATYARHDRELSNLAQSETDARYLLGTQLAYDFSFSYHIAPDGSLTREWATEGFERLTGFRWEDLPAHEDMFSITPEAEDHQMLRERAARAQRGEAMMVEYRIRTQRGDIRWLRSHTQPVWDETEKRVVRMVGAAQDITAEKTMEIALRDGEAQLRSLVDALPDVMFRIDPAGRIVDYKAERLKDLYVAPARFLGRPYQNVFPPEASEAITNAIALAKQTGRVQPLEYEIALMSFDGRLTLLGTGGAVMLMRNVTERKKAEAQLRYQAGLFDKISDGIITLDAKMRISSWNHAAEVIYGRPAASMLGRTVSRAFQTHSVPGLRRAATRILLEQGVWTGELEQTRYDGSKCYVMISATLLRDVAGQPTGCVAVVRDVTARKLAEAQLERQLHEIQSLLRISQVLSSSLDLPVVLQNAADVAATLIENVDRAVVHLVDASRTGLQVVAISGSSGYPEPMTFRLGEGLAGQVALTGDTLLVEDVHNYPNFVPLRESPHRVRSLVVAPITAGEKRLGTLSISNPIPYIFSGESGRLLTTLGLQAGLAIENARLYADLSKSLSHEQHLRQHLVQSEKLAAMGRLVSSVAHELNNPLQAIQNTLFLIDQDEILSPQGREDLRVASSEVSRMVDMVNRLRGNYRPAGQKDFQRSTFNILVEKVYTIIATHLRHAGVIFAFEPAPKLPDVLMIEDQLQQALVNLCLNAVEAMPQGGRLSVVTQADSEDGAWLVLQDTGVGIDEADLPHIFDPFFTTKSTGPGLGLSITYEIIEHHRGRIEAESFLGRGTTFRIWLPTAPPEDALPEEAEMREILTGY